MYGAQALGPCGCIVEAPRSAFVVVSTRPEMLWGYFLPIVLVWGEDNRQSSVVEPFSGVIRALLCGVGVARVWRRWLLVSVRWALTRLLAGLLLVLGRAVPVGLVTLPVLGMTGRWR